MIVGMFSHISKYASAWYLTTFFEDIVFHPQICTFNSLHAQFILVPRHCIYFRSPKPPEAGLNSLLYRIIVLQFALYLQLLCIN